MYTRARARIQLGGVIVLLSLRWIYKVKVKDIKVKVKSSSTILITLDRSFGAAFHMICLDSILVLASVAQR